MGTGTNREVRPQIPETQLIYPRRETGGPTQEACPEPFPIRNEYDSPASRAYELVEQERARIARDLHAGAGQALTAILLNLDILNGFSEAMPAPARDTITRLQLLADSALAEVRAVSHRLHPPDWQSLTAADAILQVLYQTGAQACFAQTEIRIDLLPKEPAHRTKIALYRCAQECISNVIRHSGATRLEVTLCAEGPSVNLTVRDNGKGMASTPVMPGGIGLSAIREHALSAGGSCQILTGPTGTTITLSMPLTGDESA